MIVLDTNVLSALMQRRPESQIVEWLDGQPAESVWTTAITVFEVKFGLRILGDGQRKIRLVTAFDSLLSEELEGRVLPLDAGAADLTAELFAKCRRLGRSIEIRDAMIAGITAHRKASLATRNTRHFVDTDLRIINPWDRD